MVNSNRFEVRRFDPETDLDAAYRCYKSGFYRGMWPLIDHAEPRLLKDFILVAVRISDAAFVAVANGEARGVLTGYFPNVFSQTRAAALMSGFTLKVALSRYRMRPFARAAWWRMSLGNLSVLIREPKSFAEITMLNSQEEYRGGIGRALVDAWVDEVRSRGYTNTTVVTDTTVNWTFYEKYGFERIRDFAVKTFDYALPGEDSRAFVYSMEIPLIHLGPCE
ncbi:MAG: GNAT family N-acetyltransferase [Candidatus Eisenbacteria bacterium]